MNQEQIEQVFLAKIKPYEERIQKLEEADKTKDQEIITLKHAIANLHRIIETLKGQQKHAAPAGAGAKGKPHAAPAAPAEEKPKGGKAVKETKKESKESKEKKEDEKKKDSKKGKFSLYKARGGKILFDR